MNSINKKKYHSAHQWQKGCSEVIPGLRAIPWWYLIKFISGTQTNFLGLNNLKATMN